MSSRRSYIAAVALRYGEYAWRVVASLLGFLVTLLPAYLYRLSGRKPVILVSERGVDARDNGVHFFRHLVANADDCDVYFAIAPESPDAGQIPLDRAVRFRSLRHFLLYGAASVDASSHLHGANPYGVVGAMFRPMLPRKITLFLRHGIAKDHFSLFERPLRQSDLMIAGASAEYDYLKASFPASVTSSLRMTGFARFDSLVDVKPPLRVVLFMPTFRKYIHDLTRLPADVAEKALRESAYFMGLTELLNHPRLPTVLERHGFRLLFYPHHSAHAVLPLLRCDSPVVEKAGRHTRDVQQLLKEAAVLITDFSSVFFDFGFMRKPTVFYQFDREDYRAQHYREGYFSYRDDGFGPIADTADDVVAYIESLLERGGALESQYAARVDKFFALQSFGNCRRIENAMREIAHARGLRLGRQAV